MYRHSERGNAIIFILIAIALFGSLAFTFMRGAKTGQGNLTLGQSKNAATEILSYAATVERAIDRLRQKGCSEADISYESIGNSRYSEYIHAPPSPVTCNIFDGSGGKLTPPTFGTLGYLDPAIDMTYYTGQAELFYFTIADIGSTGGGAASHDIAFVVRGVKKSICEELNKQVGFPTTDIATARWTVAAKYNGLFTAPGLSTLGSDLAGRSTACIYYGSNEFSFYHVVLAR